MTIRPINKPHPNLCSVCGFATVPGQLACTRTRHCMDASVKDLIKFLEQVIAPLHEMDQQMHSV